MSFSRYFKAISILVALMAGVSMSAVTKGKIRYAVGPKAFHEPKGKGGFIKAENGSPVFKKDNFQTGEASQITVQLPDGSALIINENTETTMLELLNEDGINRTTVDIKNGKVNFDAQKQAKGSEFKFKTGTATAAIRGTKGVVGSTRRGKFIAALSEGKLEVTDDRSGRLYAINGGQTALPVGDSLLIMELSSSGDAAFLTKIDTLLGDSSLTLDSLARSIVDADKKHQEELNQFRSELSCTVEALADTIYTHKIVVKAQCNRDVRVAIFETPVPTNGQAVEIPVDWAQSLIGPKTFPLKCYMDSLSSVNCGSVNTYYAGAKDTVVQEVAHRPLTITTGSPAKICNPASVTVEGFFDTTDAQATLTLRMGSFSTPNLVPLSVGGAFSHTIAISDKQGNWNERQIFAEFKSSSFGTETAVLNLDIDKTCKDVNRIRPEISFDSYDSLRCTMQVSARNLDSDRAIMTVAVDGTSGNETYLDKDTRLSLPLTKGVHGYELKLTDQAENKSTLSKNLGCFPAINGARISISGGTNERLRVPPPPGGIKNSFYKVLRFSVNGLPQNNPVYIKQIVISQSGKRDITLHESDIQSNQIDQQIELVRGKQATVNITVTLKSGQVLNASKTYEVR